MPSAERQKSAINIKSNKVLGLANNCFDSSKVLGLCKKGVSEEVVGSVRMEEDAFIAERVDRTLEKSEVSVGIIDGVYPTSRWHLGMLGRLKWITSSKAMPFEESDISCWSLSSDGIPREPVDVILIIGSLDRLPQD